MGANKAYSFLIRLERALLKVSPCFHTTSILKLNKEFRVNLGIKLRSRRSYLEVLLSIFILQLKSIILLNTSRNRRAINEQRKPLQATFTTRLRLKSYLKHSPNQLPNLVKPICSPRFKIDICMGGIAYLHLWGKLRTASGPPRAADCSQP